MSFESKLEIVKKNIRSYPNFPKEGILFRDIFSILGNVEAFDTLIELMLEHISGLKEHIDAIVGLESRGFLLGPLVAHRLSLPFVPVRKRGKLPGDVTRVEYFLEYGSDAFEVQKDHLPAGMSVLIVDDLLATGGSMKAACDLMEAMQVTVAECFVVMELMDLKGRHRLKSPFFSLIQY